MKNLNLNLYLSEIVSRKGHGLHTDVWSLGCMMYTFLTGKPPFDTEGTLQTLNKIRKEEFVMPQHISAEAKDLITCFLQKNPNDRIPLESKYLTWDFFFNKLTF